MGRPDPLLLAQLLCTAQDAYLLIKQQGLHAPSTTPRNRSRPAPGPRHPGADVGCDRHALSPDGEARRGGPCRVRDYRLGGHGARATPEALDGQTLTRIGPPVWTACRAAT